MVVVENTPTVHNLVVCTLCSCYPWPVLGLPPVWYKSSPYRSRAVIDPRGLLAEFGTHLPDDVEVRVWDSTAELRYIVLPERPAGTEGMSEEALAALVTRDAMVGVARVAAAGAGRPAMNGVHDMGGSRAWARCTTSGTSRSSTRRGRGASGRSAGRWERGASGTSTPAGTRSSCCRRSTTSA